MHAAFQDKGLVVLGVSIDRMAPQEMQQFLQQHQVPYPVALDTRYQAAQMYGVQGTPTSFLIDRQGKVVGGAVGPKDWHGREAIRLISRLLEKRP